MKEFKHYELRNTRKPSQDKRVASYATVVDEHGLPGYAYIAFSETFVLAVGQAMPRGVSTTDPAHVHVFYDQAHKVWSINARYLAGDGVTELWSTPEKPEWLHILRMKGGGRGNSSARKSV
jgi:hypothetical protein